MAPAPDRVRPTDTGPLPDGATPLAAPRRAALDATGRVLRRRSSRYLPMRDGCPIAVDVHLPAVELAAGVRVPTILHQTRYFRATTVRPALRPLLGTELRGDTAHTRERFLGHGYAWLDVDVRGSGASGGWRPHEWSPDEVADGAEIVDWIVRQPWSNGRVGATGVSYAGTAADFLATTAHPAVRAIAPRFSLFDVYTDVAFPGGVHLEWFTRTWGRLNDLIDRARFGAAYAAALRLYVQALAPYLPPTRRPVAARVVAALDADRIEAAVAAAMTLVAEGVRRVDEDADGSLRAAAVREHLASYDVHAEALALTFRDDPPPSRPGSTIDAFSPHVHAARVTEAGIPAFSVSGWYDAAYAHAAVKRHLTHRTAGSRLLVGPWEHGGCLQVSPESPTRLAGFDLDGELLAFFEATLKDPPGAAPPTRPVHYFTMGEERWKSAAAWPPPSAPWTLHLGPDRRLVPEPPRASAAADPYRVDPTTGTGPQARWNSLIGMHRRIGYPDRRERDARLLTYTSAPLERDVEVTGHPTVHLFVRSTAPDATVFVYLEEVTASGEVRYVTEGLLRMLHRRLAAEPPPYVHVVPYRTFLRRDAAPLAHGETAELVFDLLPVSHRFRRGDAVRLALAGADRDHFARLPGPAPELAFERSARHASRIVLPVVAAPL